MLALDYNSIDEKYKELRSLVFENEIEGSVKSLFSGRWYVHLQTKKITFHFRNNEVVHIMKVISDTAWKIKNHHQSLIIREFYQGSSAPKYAFLISALLELFLNPECRRIKGFYLSLHKHFYHSPPSPYALLVFFFVFLCIFCHVTTYTIFRSMFFLFLSCVHVIIRTEPRYLEFSEILLWFLFDVILYPYVPEFREPETMSLIKLFTCLDPASQNPVATIVSSDNRFRSVIYDPEAQLQILGVTESISPVLLDVIAVPWISRLCNYHVQYLLSAYVVCHVLILFVLLLFFF